MTHPPITVVFLIFPDVTQLDLTGPAEVFASAEGFRVELAWKTREPVITDGGWAIAPTRTFADAPQADVLMIPGGGGVDALLGDPEVRDFVRRQAAGAQWVTSVCTGALVLGAAGLLRGKRATTHWSSHQFLADFGAVPVHERFVRDGFVYTAAGVSAGIDMGLALVGQIAGDAVVADAQLEMEYAPAPPYNFGSPDVFPSEHIEGIVDAVRARRGPLVEAAVQELDALNAADPADPTSTVIPAETTKSALIVIDVQRDVIAGAFDVDAVVSRIADLVDRARAANALVVWVQHVDEDLVVGSDAWALDSRLVPIEGEPRLTKTFSDSFSNPELEELLRVAGVGRVVLAGAQSDFCVRNTYHGALVRGFDTVLVSDAHTTLDREFGGRVVPASEIVEFTNMLAGQPGSWKGVVGSALPAADVVFG